MGHQLIILDLLSRRAGVLISSDTIIDAMYSGRRDGGPDKARNVLSVTINRLKNTIEAFGWTISSVGRGSGNSASYRLIPVEAGQ